METRTDYLKCIFCNSTELTYNANVMDSYCSECGKWQEGEEIKQYENDVDILLQMADKE
tara:strand:+ start:250 stop:426 length:177 start_codon:yes stop_codon:yes gene_type:complete